MDSKPRRFSDLSAHVSDYSESEPPTAVSPAFPEKIALAPSQQWITRPDQPRLLGLLPAAAVIVTTLGFAVGILGVLLVKQCHETQRGQGISPAIRDGVFYTFENHNQNPDSKSHLLVVTISSVANQIVSATSSIVMTLVAYQVGAEWLRLSKGQSSTSAAETPTPAQYGLLVRLLGSWSIGSIFEAFIYTAQSWNRARLPRMFRYSMWMATAVWVLARLVGLADLWLHSTSFTLRSNITLPDSSPGATPMWGVSLNTSICDDMKTKYNISNDYPELGCLWPYEYFVFYENWGHAMGFEAMTNTTDAAFRVGTVEGDIAFAFPGPKVVDMRSKNFLIPTFAARASCGLLNKACKQNANETLDCTSAGYPNFPYYRPDDNGVPTTRIVNRVLGVVGQDIVGLEAGSAESLRTPSNPAKMAIQLQWENLEQGNGTGIPVKSASEIVTSVGDLAVDPNHPTLYAGCNLTFLDAFVEWNSMKQDWHLLNATESSPDLTATLWLPIVWQYGTERLASNLMYTAREDTTEEAMRALGQNLATLTLATAAGFYRPREAYNITKTQRILVSAYPTLPIMTLLVLLCIYASLTLAIFLSSYWTPDEAIIVPVADYELQDEEMESSTVTLAQRWLTHPLPLVGSSFSRQDGQDGVRSAAYSAVNAAYDGDEGYTRLTIGLAGDRFGITPWGQR